MLKKNVNIACDLFYLFFFYLIFILAYGNMVSSSYLAAIFVFPILAVTVFLSTQKYKFSISVPVECIWYILWLLSFALMLVISFHLKVDYNGTWDWGKLLRTASAYVLEGGLEDKIYFSRYPNNQMWLCCLIILFKIVKKIYGGADIDTFYHVSIVVSCVCVSLTMLLVYYTAKAIWDSKRAFVVGVFSILCSPFYLYALFAYTDTSGMLVLMLFVYIFVLLVNRSHLHNKKWYFAMAFLLGLLAAAMWSLKVTIFIICIAAIMTVWLVVENWKKMIMIFVTVALAFSIGHVAINKGVAHFIDISEETYDEYEFPLTHWIMMSLDYGGYVQEDVDYTSSFPDYKTKQEANIKEIKERVKEKGVIGCVKHIFYTKLKRTWCDATFSGSLYIAQHPLNPDGFLERLFNYTGDLYWLFLIYAELFYAVLLFGVILSAVCSLKKDVKAQPLFFLRLAVLGLILFLSLWECNSRYVVAYLPILILLSGDGFYELRRKVFLSAETRERRED